MKRFFLGIFAAAFVPATIFVPNAQANDEAWLELEKPISEQIATSRLPGGANSIVTGSHRPLNQQRRGLLQALFKPDTQPATRPSTRQVQPATVRRAPPVRRQAVRQPSRQIDPKYLPQVVRYSTGQAPGTIIIDTGSRFLYLVQGDGKARRYGVGVGRTGFGWNGTVTIGRKAEWPTWTPPASMIKREPQLAKYASGMPGGPTNPLGARALYLYKGGRDTIYRIHGSNEPWTIGQAVSSGCIRMRNEDVSDLYGRVGVGTKVVVL